MPADKFAETFGKMYFNELNLAAEFLWSLPFATGLQKHEIFALAASSERIKVPPNTLVKN